MDALVSSLRELAARATPQGHWKPSEWYGEDGSWTAIGPVHDEEDIPIEDWQDGDGEPDGRLHDLAKADSAFIAALANAWPALLSRIEAADAMEEAARALMNESSGLRAFEDEVRSAISNTNWRCIMDRVEQTRSALAAYSAAKGVS